MCRNLLIAAALTSAVIVYGSLYPFTFDQPVNGTGPVQTLLDSADQGFNLGDFLANILLYLPLGLFAAAGFGRKAGALTGTSLAVASGACLSIAMELGQYYVPGRVTTAEDCYANVVGTALGAVAGSVVNVDFRSPALRQMAANPVPGLLLVL